MMAIEIKIPAVGESINEVQIGDWLKREGDQVEKDENLVVIESEKASVELPAPEAGTLARILKQKGEMVAVGAVVAEMETGTPPAKKTKAPAAATARKQKPKEPEPAKAPAPESKGPPKSRPTARVMPAAQRLMAERGVSAEEVEPSGPGGRILKEDVQRHFEEREKGRAETKQVEIAVAPAAPGTGDRQEEVVPMSLLRRTVARRLVEAQQTMAMLTTFNEVDMSAVMSLRQTHQEAFQKKHGVKVGFMSFFVKAAVDALGAFPQVNAEVRGTDVIYHNYYDIGVAIGGGKGLVVPVLRHAERMSFAEIEKAIQEFAARAQENQLKPEELQGGTFTISNGGVYGSLLSTPIVNPPQSGILGMHTIQERPVALAGTVVIRPMMYLALSYDHRIVDGREAVGFLKRIKEVVESPARLLLEA